MPGSLRLAATGLLITLAGAVLGLVFGLATPAHTEIAGGDAEIQLHFGRGYDELDVEGALAAKRASERSALGERVGVRVRVDLDVRALFDEHGQFNVDVLPAYVQTFSDPAQLIADGRRALVRHLAWFGGVGAGTALAVFGAGAGYRRWRRRFDARQWPDRNQRLLARAYWLPERRFAVRAARVVVVLVVLGAIPSGGRHAPAPVRLRAEPLFDGTQLAGVEIDGLLRPALVAAENYIDTYFEQTNTYYDELTATLLGTLAADPVPLPGADDGDGVVQLGFVSDRHCNIGMDRVVVALLTHYDITTLVSAGDDAFSGSFPFESACTRNLASKSAQAGIGAVFVGGNHDSPATIAAEDQQGIVTLTGGIKEVGGLAFTGTPDPRSSRYGQGIVPSARDAQDRLVLAQGRAAGRATCDSSVPVIAVLHGPPAGRAAVQSGCGRVVLALDGHTHLQSGPSAIPLTGGGTGYQFTSGSTGGAPREGDIERSFASRLTVGPLNHDAVINIVSVRAGSGELVGVTEFHITPDQTINIEQQLVG